MIYVFDNTPLSHLFKSYYRNRFPSLWERFDEIVAEERLVSTREVLREIGDGPDENLIDWTADNKQVFTTPNADEGIFVGKIFAVKHFQQIIERKKLIRGGRNADPFVIAKAAAIEGTVVSLEKEKPNGAKIPNICGHFDISCMSLEDFMEEEGWKF